MHSRRWWLAGAVFFLARAAYGAGRAGAEAAGEIRLTGQAAPIAPRLQAAPVPMQLQSPSLNLTPAVMAAPAVAPAVQAPQLAPPAASPLIEARLEAVSPIATRPQRTAVPDGLAAPARTKTDESLAQDGRILFDQSAVAAPEPSAVPVTEPRRSAGSWIRSLLKRPDQVPAWPGKIGDKLRVDGRTYVLDRKIGEGGGSVIYQSGGYAIKLIHPEFKRLPLYGDEAQSLEALARTNIPHAKLVARSADGQVLVKEFIDGKSARSLLADGPLTQRQKELLAEFAARLLAIGYTADLVPANLVYAPWRSSWILIDAGGFRPARPQETLVQLLSTDFIRKGGLDPVAFLSSVRGRLGPDSRDWNGASRQTPSSSINSRGTLPADE